LSARRRLCFSLRGVGLLHGEFFEGSQRINEAVGRPPPP
jgi:hypothetical protein